MKNGLKFLIVFFFLISVSFYWLIPLNIGNDNIEYKYSIVETLHELNYFLIFPILATIIFMYFFRKKKEIVLMDYFTSWIIIAFFVILFNSIPNFYFCEFKEAGTLYVSINNSNTIVLREERCGVVGADGDYVQLKSPYLFIFNKYEEVDTNTLDLTNWTKL
jgi:hypothetical protein